MDDLKRLDPIEREHFAAIVEASLRVTERRLFFGWMQGILQALVPHEILICGAAEAGIESIKLCFFSASRYFREEHFAASCAKGTGVVSRLIADWQATGEPRIIARGTAHNGTAAIVDELEAVELRNIALHGVLGPGRRVLGIYGYARVAPEFATARLGYVLELLTPHVHTAFVRVRMRETEGAVGSARLGARHVTPREAEILRWIKEGKTNSDIAAILELSPWTVKNHVQTILKKLRAQTRSHAVARAMSMGILDGRE